MPEIDVQKFDTKEHESMFLKMEKASFELTRGIGIIEYYDLDDLQTKIFQDFLAGFTLQIINLNDLNIANCDWRNRFIPGFTNNSRTRDFKRSVNEEVAVLFFT
jgi:hypothetical protein